MRSNSRSGSWPRSARSTSTQREGREGGAASAERYADIGLGLADASLVVLAERLDAIEIATLDQRHFRVVRPLAGGGAFRLLPADA
jgi:hypothetical protein